MDIQHAMMVRSDPQEIYRALTEPDGLSAWFGPECRAAPRVRSPVEVIFHDRHNYTLEFEVMDLEPGARVVWKVVWAISSWDDFPSTVFWRLIPYEGSTIVELRHSGWPDGHEAYPSVSFKWAEFMIALRTHVHTGEKQIPGVG
jgi:uncharacterized protein YndB with AHSA1/START domain